MQKSNYGFLKKLQQNERKKDNPNTMKIAIVGGAPLSHRFGKESEVSFTGLGEDGRLQPGNPAKMVETENGTSMLHEGELEVRLPDGRTTIIPADQIPQQMMQKLEKSQLKGPKGDTQMEGLQRGGDFRSRFNQPTRTGRVPRIQPVVNPNVTPINPQAQNQGFQVGPTQGGTLTNVNQGPNQLNTGPNIGPIQGGELTDVDPNVFTANPQGFQSGTHVANPQGWTTDGSVVNPVTKDDPNKQGFVIDTSQFDPYDVTLPEGTGQDKVDVADPNQQGWTTDGSEIDVEKELEEINNIDPEQLSGSQLGQYISQLQMIASGQGKLGKQAMIEAQQKYKAEEQAARESQLQGMAQADVTGREALTEQAMLTRDLSAAEAGLEGQLRKQQDERAFAAAQQLPGAQLAADQFEEGQEQFDEQMAFAKEKYGDQLGQRIAQAINSGVPLNKLNEMFPDANISQSDYDSMKDVTSSTQWQKAFDLSADQWQQQFDVTEDQWNKQYDFAKEQYGDKEGQRIVADINSGMTYSQIKAKYPNVTQADYDSIKDAGPIGQMDYKKKMDMLAMKKDAGDLEGWAEEFADIYGTGIDIGHLQSEQDMDNFYKGMDVMQGLIETGVDWETAKKMMGDSGALEMLGMTEGDAEAFFNSSKLQSDPLYKMDTMVQGWIDEGLITEEDGDKYMAIFTDGLVNPDNYKVEDGWAVYDEKGNEKYFSTDMADVEKFIADNPDKKYTFEEIDNHIKHTDGGPDGSGDDDDPDATTTYEQYVKDAEAGGQIPMQENEWEKGGKKKYEGGNTNEQFASFEDSIPSTEIDKWDLDRWELAGRPTTYDAYKNKPQGDLTQKNYDKFTEDGWASITYDYKYAKGKPDEIKEARKNFLAHPENAMEFDSIEEIQDMSFEEWNKHFGGEGKDGAVFFINGVDTPLMLSTPRGYRKTKFENMTTGGPVTVWWNEAGDGGISGGGL